MRANQIFALIKDKVERTEREIRRELASDVPVVEEMGSYITGSGGKRIRPALLCLCAAACGYQGDKDVRYGVVFELVHTATLIHDDIIDSAEIRRGRPVMHGLYGTTLSILFGDFLYNTAMGLALRDGDLRIIRLISDATGRMIEGEIIQNNCNFKVDVSFDDYMDLIRRKTANLFSSCALAGAVLAGAEKQVEKGMSDYGLNLGIAFQLIDDYFDYSATVKRIGKPVGSDLSEGKVTYPLLVLFSRAGEEAVRLVEEAFADRSRSADVSKKLLKLMRQHGALEETVGAAEKFAAKAVESLQQIPQSDYCQALKQLPRYVIERKK